MLCYYGIVHNFELSGLSLSKPCRSLSLYSSVPSCLRDSKKLCAPLRLRVFAAPFPSSFLVLPLMRDRLCSSVHLFVPPRRPHHQELPVPVVHAVECLVQLDHFVGVLEEMD